MNQQVKLSHTRPTLCTIYHSGKKINKLFLGRDTKLDDRIRSEKQLPSTARAPISTIPHVVRTIFPRMGVQKRGRRGKGTSIVKTSHEKCTCVLPSPRHAVLSLTISGKKFVIILNSTRRRHGPSHQEAQAQWHDHTQQGFGQGLCQTSQSRKAEGLLTSSSDQCTSRYPQ